MKVFVVEYDPAWIVMFHEEAARLAAVLGDAVLRIEHVGSTAVPGLQAKPLIDLLPVVTDINRVDDLTPALEEMGYVARGDYGIAGRRLFTKPSLETPTHNVHCYQVGNPEIADRVDFRDYLRAHPEHAADYGALKERLADEFPTDVTSYVKGKNDFVSKTLQLAAAWRARATRESARG
jgi:GrpB-like predicted nucleotidyltransferase (UPF0157 family)